MLFGITEFVRNFVNQSTENARERMLQDLFSLFALILDPVKQFLWKMSVFMKTLETIHIRHNLEYVIFKNFKRKTTSQLEEKNKKNLQLITI